MPDVVDADFTDKLAAEAIDDGEGVVHQSIVLVLAGALAWRPGIREQFAVARMYNKAVPELPLERVFCVMSMEVG